MKTFVIAFILFILGSTALGQDQESSMKILNAEDFAKNQIDRGSGRESLELKVQINPALAPYRFDIVPDLAVTDSAGSNNPPHHVGWIDVSYGKSSATIQKIDVRTSAGVSNLTQFFRAEDINFDGFLDIGVVNDFGAKWVKVNYWLYDKLTGQFIISPLTQELKGITFSQMDLDNNTETINFRSYIGTCPQNEIYQIRNGHLVLVESEERECTGKGQEILVKTYVKKRINGRMKLVKIELESDEATGMPE